VRRSYAGKFAFEEFNLSLKTGHPRLSAVKTLKLTGSFYL
jgi:hypothetical protein